MVEVLIAVAIVGILAAIAIPVFQGYVARAKVADAVQGSRGIKLRVVEFFEFGNQLPQDNAEAGAEPAADYATANVSSMEIVANGQIVITLSIPRLVGETLTLTPTPDGNDLNWSCSTTLPSNLAPAKCR